MMYKIVIKWPDALRTKLNKMLMMIESLLYQEEEGGRGQAVI